VCVCAFSLRQESPDMILGDKPLIFEVVLSQLEDPRSVPFNIDVAYATGGVTPHKRYVKISIIFC
jgi:hypothetical protein